MTSSPPVKPSKRLSQQVAIEAALAALQAEGKPFRVQDVIERSGVPQGSYYTFKALVRQVLTAAQESQRLARVELAPPAVAAEAAEVAIDLDAQPQPATQPEKPPAVVLDRAFVITSESSAEDGEPYRPSNGTEGEIFTANWCDKCERDINEDCPILMESLLDGAAEWQYWNGRPVCTAWQQRTTPPRPELVQDRTTVTVTMPRSTFQPTKSWSAEMAAAPVERAASFADPGRIAPATTNYPDSTPPTRYQGCRYWVAGDSGNGKNGRYWHFIALEEGGELIRTIQSEEEFSSVVAANQAARGAISRLASISLEAKSA